MTKKIAVLVGGDIMPRLTPALIALIAVEHSQNTVVREDVYDRSISLDANERKTAQWKHEVNPVHPHRNTMKALRKGKK